jgi:hypothetical protein
VTLRRDPVLEEIRQAMAAEDSAEYLLLAQGSLESSLSAGDDLDPAVFLTEFAQALSSLQVTQRMDAMSWIELLACQSPPTPLSIADVQCLGLMYVV